jgi:release factor glutamine methyltransferase
VGEVVAAVAARLAAAGVPTPGVAAELLAAHALGLTRGGLLLAAGAALPAGAAAALETLADRRAARAVARTPPWPPAGSCAP